jgi:hypothetical protein
MIPAAVWRTVAPTQPAGRPSTVCSFARNERRATLQVVAGVVVDKALRFQIRLRQSR